MAHRILSGLSAELAEVVAQTAPSVVRVDDGSRLTATGIIWTADGFILTTSHGVERDEELTVELADGTRLPATVAGRDDESDLALLKISGTDLPAAVFAAPDAAQVGHLVVALGRPGAAGLQATLGIVSARLEAQSAGRPEYILHTDATLYPGFSGGPLVNMEGQVVGLINLALGRGQGVALGSPLLHHVAEALKTRGTVKRGYLGVSTQTIRLPESLRSTLSSSQEYGLLVVQAAPGSAAEAAGLLPGDILLAVGGETLADSGTLRARLRALNAGQTAALTLLRGGQPQQVTVTLGEME